MPLRTLVPQMRTAERPQMPETKDTTPISGADDDLDSAIPLKLLQITDTHLFADPNGRLLGQNTRHTFELVLELARERFWPPDAIILTGDLVHDGLPEAYQYLKRQLSHLEIPFFSVPGNHDLPNLITSTLNTDSGHTVCGMQQRGWSLVLIDSTMPSADGGHISRSQLAGLEHALGAHPDLHTLIGLHHQPVPVGSAWIDSMALGNANELFAITDRHPQVRGILWGHIHQAFSARRNTLMLLGSPSTCIQFLPGSEHFALDALTPGFRWLELFLDGRIETGIERLTAYPDPLMITNHGY